MPFPEDEEGLFELLVLLLAHEGAGVWMPDISVGEELTLGGGVWMPAISVGSYEVEGRSVGAMVGAAMATNCNRTSNSPSLLESYSKKHVAPGTSCRLAKVSEGMTKGSIVVTGVPAS